MDNEEMKGKLQQAKGHVEEKIGKVTGDEDLEEDGKADKPRARLAKARRRRSRSNALLEVTARPGEAAPSPRRAT